METDHIPERTIELKITLNEKQFKPLFDLIKFLAIDRRPMSIDDIYGAETDDA
jgi:hypothetical protein